LGKKGRFAKVSEIYAVVERSLSIGIQMRSPWIIEDDLLNWAVKIDMGNDASIWR